MGKNTNRVVYEQTKMHMKKPSKSMKDITENLREQQELTEKFSELMKNIKEDLREQQEQNDNSYSKNKKDMTKYIEAPRDIQPREEIQKVLGKCFESRMSHKYSEFEVIESRGISTSSNGKVAMREGVKFFIKQLDHESAQAFITEVIAGPLYRLTLFGKSPKIWLIDDDQGQVYLGSEFLPNFNTFADLFKKAVTSSEINPKNCLEEQIQHKFKRELQKSAGSSRQFAKLLAACLIFREFDFNLGNFGIIEMNDPDIAEKKWAKVDHGLSFEYKYLNSCLYKSDCLEILKFYLQDRKQCKNQTLDNLVKEILKELANYDELSEELDNMCRFLEESKALIEQLIDKQIKDLIKILGHTHYNIEFTICKDTFVYDNEKHIFVNLNDTEQYKCVADQGNKFNQCFKEMLYDQVKKAKDFSSIKDNDLGGKLGEVQSISHSQSLRSLHFSGSDFEVISISQCRSMYPGSELSEVQPISHSQSLNSLHSSNSDFEVISTSQCR